MYRQNSSTNHFQRIILMVADSCGIGALPDAAQWGDAGANTIGHTLSATGVRLPNLQQMGLGNIHALPNHPPVKNPGGAFGKLVTESQGKDTTVGHWEMAGIYTERPFPVYPNGFPAELMEAFKEVTGLDWLGNRAASGTVIIEELGPTHLRTGFPIVYTSADSVFQIAAHEDVIPPEALYEICLKVRALLVPPHQMARVIARPFNGSPGIFRRTANRRDFALKTPEPNLLSELASRHINCVSVGKIASIFAWKNTGQEIHTRDNTEGLSVTLKLLKENEAPFVFINLVDFDSHYGHRNDPVGYARALRELDDAVPALRANLRSSDLFVLTADHGCDPTTPSTDHTREYVPILCWGANVTPATHLGVRTSLADIGQTIAENFNFRLSMGTSFLDAIYKRR